MEPRASRAAAFMVLGTSSHVGKSAVAAGLCRLLARRGVRVVPFKAQNMSNNAFVTPEGREIGRAQAVQARAAGVECHADMNPVLLKPCGDGISQVVLHGLPHGNRGPRDYYAEKAFLAAEARGAYDRLAARFEAVVLEGAGSPAEINLRDGDFVNGAMAEHAGARCLLVADIERGGVFAAIHGTLALMEARHRALVAGVVVNKFRGDASLLEPGIREIEALTGVPVLGVLPWLEGLALDEEDSLGVPEAGGPAPVALLDVAVVRLPRLANATDLQPLSAAEGFHVRYVTDAVRLGNPDLVILPGSKAVRADLAWLAETGLDRAVRAAVSRGLPVLGLCGGFQMLGRAVADPHGVEGPPGTSAGLGLLAAETVMEREKELRRARGRNLALPFLPPGAPVAGYEIHMGRTRAEDAPALGLDLPGEARPEAAGAVAADGRVMGFYLHGVFEDAAVRRALREWLWSRRGVAAPPLEGAGIGAREGFDVLADALERHADLGTLLGPALAAVRTRDFPAP